MIPSVVVDTDVVSFIFKQDTRSLLYEPHLKGKVMLCSFMTLAELHQWANLHNWGQTKRKKMDEYLQRFVILQSDEDICLKWAEVRAEAKRKGRPIETADAWIAATALLLQVPMVTHNRAHYVDVSGLRIISEASP